MHSLLFFALITTAILLTPGPTNTLLATGGAMTGMHRAWPLMLAELLGYCISITAIGVVLRPLAVQVPAVAIGVRLIAAAYLVYLAWHLFHWRWAMPSAGGAVTWRRVFLTTLLNPKALIFALALIPFGTADAGRYMLLFACLVVPISALWIALGAVLGNMARRARRDHLVSRIAAGILGIFAFALALSAIPR